MDLQIFSLDDVLCPYSLLAFTGQEDKGPRKQNHGPRVAIYVALIINHIQLKGINAQYGNISLWDQV